MGKTQKYKRPSLRGSDVRCGRILARKMKYKTPNQNNPRVKVSVPLIPILLQHYFGNHVELIGLAFVCGMLFALFGIVGEISTRRRKNDWRKVFFVLFYLGLVLVFVSCISAAIIYFWREWKG